MLSTGVSTLQLLSHPQQPPRLHHLAEEHKKVQVTICTKSGVSHLHLIFLTSLYNELTCWNVSGIAQQRRNWAEGGEVGRAARSVDTACMMQLWCICICSICHDTGEPSNLCQESRTAWKCNFTNKQLDNNSGLPRPASWLCYRVLIQSCQAAWEWFLRSLDTWLPSRHVLSFPASVPHP